ncbi:hypothetical protein CPLU01_16057 [Colletotrichum plurivorum]|uniref:Uncharacterized protein n=1 Tax=Colletotrichum plurivorum TaxID=2175906 RepID=A0A8H6MQG0_9PEZI|nr:hypothetical protein CPLU01_16057 [Colletotrichum plurivorum]
MNDDLSRIDSEVDGKELPEFFWWPHVPREATLRELAWRRPDLAHQVTLACIAGDHEELFRELSDGTKPTLQQWEAACESPLESYRQILQERAKQQKPNLCPTYLGFDSNNVWDGCTRPGWWSRDYLRPVKELDTDDYGLPIPKKLYNTPDDGDWEDPDPPEGHLLNHHMQEQVEDWQLLISATDKARREAKAHDKPVILYSMDEDRNRREGPPPQPRYPKKFPEEED